MCPPSFHHNSFVVAHALRCMIYCTWGCTTSTWVHGNRTSCAQVHELPTKPLWR